MTSQLVPFVITTLLGSMVAVSGVQGAGRQATPQPPEAGQPQTPEEIEQEKEKKKKKQQQEQQEKTAPAAASAREAGAG